MPTRATNPTPLGSQPPSQPMPQGTELQLDPGFYLKFWGVRGSVPSPGKETVRYGGNTSCIEMEIDGKRLIFDGGTGLRMLGKQLDPDTPFEAYHFFTHYHWDHIQGIPLFDPLFSENNCLHIHGPVPPNSESLQQHFYDRILNAKMSPVPIQRIHAELKFYDLDRGKAFKLDEIEIETGELNHPNGALGYRVSWQGHTVVYCTDTEHFADHIDENILELARDADLLIYDAMYTDEEYSNPKSPKIGWGHSTWQEGVKVCQAARVKRFVVFHHEPNHSDEQLDRIGEQAQAIFPNTLLAKEGLVLRVDR